MTDWFADAFGATIGDIRNRWEELWFDRAVTPNSSSSHQHEAGQSVADKLGWGERETQRRDQDTPDHDFGR